MTKRRIRWLAFVLVVLLCAWVGLSPRVAQSLYADKLFLPDEYQGSMQELYDYDEYENREVRFEACDGSVIHGWIVYRTGADQIFLVSHGNVGNIATRWELVRLLLKTGASVFIYDYRGYGQSEGSPSVKGICEDGVSAFDCLVRQGFKPSQIVLYGESLGSAVTTYISSVRECAGLILQAPFASLEKISKEKMPIVRIFPSFLYPVPRLDNVALLTGEHPPLLLLHGEKDELTKIHHSEEIYSKASGPKQFVRLSNSSHTHLGSDDRAVFIEVITEFLASLP